MLELIKYPGSFSFTGNPILFTFKTDKSDLIEVRILINEYEVFAQFTPYLGDDGFYYSTFSLSGTLKSYFKNIRIETGQIFSVPANFTLVYMITASQEDTNPPFNSFICLNGGVSNTLLSQLAKDGLDIFSYRLYNPLRQFLFTTRTNSPSVLVRESELYPFIFISPSESIQIVTRTGRIITQVLEKQHAYCLDLEALRKVIFDLYNEMPSYFAVIVDGSHAFSITLIPNILSEESHLFLFKNSLGGYEKIELTGKSVYNPETAEESTWNLLDDNYVFGEERDRVQRRDIFSIDTGYDTRDRLFFILDMASSDEIYYLDENNRRYKCLISTDSPAINMKMVTPGSLKVNIRLTYDESLYSPDLDYSYPDDIFTNITQPGKPQLNGYGLFMGDQISFNGQ